MASDDAQSRRTWAFTHCALERHLIDPTKAAEILQQALAHPDRTAEELLANVGIAADLGELLTIQNQVSELLASPPDHLLGTIASLPLNPATRLGLGLPPTAVSEPPDPLCTLPHAPSPTPPPAPTPSQSGHPSDFEVLSPTAERLGALPPSPPIRGLNPSESLSALGPDSAATHVFPGTDTPRPGSASGQPSGFPLDTGQGAEGPATIPDFSPSDWASFPSDASSRSSSELRLLPTSSERFRILRQHARGGLGAVSVAFDEELRREVALKEIRDLHAEDASSRARFLIEAEVTGGLEHPGVVPVYSLGRNPEGRPFYAMRFIRGESLRKALEKFEEEKPSLSPPDRQFRLRGFLRRFVDVCNAIQYAHSRQIIHRDLKPDNIMLGPFGETLVVDWGLAKALDRPDLQPLSAESPLRPVTQVGASGTLDGSVLGTPQFMAPEQALGATSSLGPPCDIYSLGATLYNILTGRVPFTDSRLMDIIEKVRAGSFPPPRAVDPSIPPALNAIVLKAMALRPEDRYPSCRALADDIERWLADEPVSVYRDPWTVRLSRWAKRHRSLVASTAVLLPSLLVGLSAFTFLISREKARTEIQYARAEGNFQTAMDAIDSLLTEVGEIELRDVPQLEATRKALLQKALDFYTSFLATNDRAGLRREVARARSRVGEIQDLLGDLNQADSAFRQAITLHRQLLADQPSNPALQEDLASSLHLHGLVLKKLNRFDESETSLDEAIRIREALQTLEPGNPERRRVVASSQYHKGAVLARLEGRTAEARSLYNQAIATQRDLLNVPRPDPQDERLLARYLNNLARLVRSSGDAETASLFESAVSLQRRLAQLYPAQPSYRADLAWYLNNRAALRLRSDLPGAQNDLREALSIAQALTQDHPLVPDYWRDLSVYEKSSGILARQQGLQSDALDAFSRSIDALNRSIEIRRNLVRDYPDRPEFRHRLALALNDLGAFRRGQGHPDASRSAIDEGIALLRELVQKHPSVHEYRRDLANLLYEDGSLRVQSGDLDNALVAFSSSLAEATTAWSERPNDLDYITPRRLALRGLADVSLLRREPHQALSYIQGFAQAANGSARDQSVAATLTLRAIELVPTLPQAEQPAFHSSCIQLIADTLSSSFDPAFSVPVDVLSLFTPYRDDPRIDSALTRLGLPRPAAQ